MLSLGASSAKDYKRELRREPLDFLLPYEPDFATAPARMTGSTSIVSCEKN